jgi:tetratricopeptide (TPR) repeat protein
VHKCNQMRGKVAAIAAIGMMVLTGAARQASAQDAGKPEKKYKDQGEYNVFNDVVKDVNGNNFTKAVADLDTWTQKYPQTDFASERTYYYLRAYSGSNQPAKVLEIASQLLAKDIRATYSPFDALSIYALSAYAIRQLPNATAEQLAIGQKAAQEGLDFVPTYFVAANKPAATSEDQWNQARAKVEADMRAALLFVAMLPGTQAQNRKDYEGAEAAFTKALQQYPDCPQIAFALGGAQIAQQKPERIPAAIYAIARAAALDPGKWGPDAAATNKTAAAYLERVYTRYHGQDPEGLQQLKQLALQSPFPPADFKIKTASEVAAEKENEFREKNPQLALWMGIKRQLTDTNGDQYYETTMKGTEIVGQNGTRALKGTLVDAKPACRSKELLVAISDAEHAEVTLKLNAALTGKPQIGSQIQFDGAPSGFSKDPFMLSMDTEKAKIDGLQMDPCAPPRTAVGKRTGKKKK